MRDQEARRQWTQDGARRATCRDDRVEALGLIADEDVGHEAPEHRVGEQVDHGQEDRECGRRLRRHRAIQQHRERDQRSDHDHVHRRHEMTALHARHQRAIQGHQCQHADEDRREHGWQQARAIRGNQRFTHRAQDVVAEQLAEEKQERPQQGDAFMLVRTQSPVAAAVMRATSLISLPRRATSAPRKLR